MQRFVFGRAHAVWGAWPKSLSPRRSASLTISLKLCVATSAQSFECNGHIIVQRQSFVLHASIHKAFDALMSMGETKTNRSGGMSRTPPRFRRLPCFLSLFWLRFAKSKLAALGLFLQPHANSPTCIVLKKEKPQSLASTLEVTAVRSTKDYGWKSLKSNVIGVTAVIVIRALLECW